MELNFPAIEVLLEKKKEEEQGLWPSMDIGRCKEIFHLESVKRPGSAGSSLVAPPSRPDDGIRNPVL